MTNEQILEHYEATIEDLRGLKEEIENTVDMQINIYKVLIMELKQED